MREIDAPTTRVRLALWDVDNVDAHVNNMLEKSLHALGMYLDEPKKRQRLFQYLRTRCWQLSGLEADAKTVKYVWVVHGLIAPPGQNSSYERIKLPEFDDPWNAELALEGIREQLAARGLTERHLIGARVEKCRPRRAYDRAFGLSFSTYSYRTLVPRGVIDWLRSDKDDFGDTRYANGQRPDSLEALGERMRRGQPSDESYIDRYGPGARLEFVDELNPHAYDDPIEEVLTNAARGR